jgi:hypothetical protein
MSPKKHRQVPKGTGRRYISTKPRPEQAPYRRTSAPPPSKAESSLRKRIQNYAFQERFKPDFKLAMGAYFELKNEPGDPANHPIPEQELPGFQEWYFNDYITLAGDRIIDRLAVEIGPELPKEQALILDDWRVWNRLRLFEVQQVEPGIGETMLDLLSGEIMEVNDISASYSLSRWQIILIRPLLTLGRVNFTGIAKQFTPMDKPALLEAARALWDKYQVEHPQATVSDFYRDHSLDLIYAERRVIEEKSKPRDYLTAEGHPIVISKARYAILRDPTAVEAILDGAEEFVYGGHSKESRGALHYNWILRGRSRIADHPSPPENGLRLETHWMDESGHPKFRTLGDLTLAPEWLELDAMSRERLASGKALLEELLAGLVVHQRDRFTNFDKFLGKAERSTQARVKSPRDEIPLEDKAKIMRAMSEEQTEHWLNEPIPALNHLTPRQAAQSPENRGKLLDLLKLTDYLDNQRILGGELPMYDLERIKRELGIDDLM